jgi:hypothetical protein
MRLETDKTRPDGLTWKAVEGNVKIEMVPDRKRGMVV